MSWSSSYKDRPLASESPLSSLQVYSQFIASVPDQFPSVRRSTLTLYSVSPRHLVVRGELEFAGGIRLRVAERIDTARARMTWYSYAVLRGAEELYWYDPQPHPDDPSLASTFPHHKHVPPNIKRNRMPAPGISFTRPNLPFVIHEVEKDVLGSETA